MASSTCTAFADHTLILSANLRAEAISSLFYTHIVM